MNWLSVVKKKGLTESRSLIAGVESGSSEAEPFSRTQDTRFLRDVQVRRLGIFMPAQQNQ